MSHEIPGRLWESVGADIFTIDNKCYLHIVDYHSKFPIIEQVEGFGTENLIKTCKIFLEYGLTRKMVSDVSTNFISEKFENVCKRLHIHHAVSSSYNHQSN